METALKIPDANVSYAITAEFRSEENRIHFYSFSVEAGHVLNFQLAVPAISSLEDFAPVVLLVGPGVAAPDGFTSTILDQFEIELDSGLGAATYVYEGAENEVEFEPFTQVNLWVRQEAEVALAYQGTYYLAVVVPGEWEQDATSGYGKYMLAPGVLERFSVFDYIAIPVDWVKWHSFWGDSLVVLMIPTFVVVAGMCLATWSWTRDGRPEALMGRSDLAKALFFLSVIGSALMIGSAVNQLLLVFWNSMSSFETIAAVVIVLQVFGMLLGTLALRITLRVAGPKSQKYLVLSISTAILVTFGALIVGAGWIFGPLLFLFAYVAGLVLISRTSPIAIH